MSLAPLAYGAPMQLPTTKAGHDGMACSLCPHHSHRHALLSSTAKPPRRTPGRAPGLRVFALDAAMPFDFEHRMVAKMQSQQALKIGIVGFGTFGQFLAKRFVKAGHQVIATSRTPYYKEAAEMGVGYYTDADDFCEEHPDVVILATSILSLEQVLSKLPIMRLRRSTLFVDVLSVKEFPKRLLLAKLPQEVDILCTHPMFGPDSGKGSWSGLNFMYEKVRIGEDEARQQRVDTFLNFFATEGCTMVEMTCEEHDRHAASTQVKNLPSTLCHAALQFITHTVGRMLGAMGLQPTVIDTKGFQSLLSLVDNTAHDSFELYYGLFMYNQNATAELERLEDALNQVKRQLLDQLHNKVRQQIFYAPDTSLLKAAAAMAAGARGGEGGRDNAAGASGSGSDSDSGGVEAGAAAAAQRDGEPQKLLQPLAAQLQLAEGSSTGGPTAAGGGGKAAPNGSGNGNAAGGEKGGKQQPSAAQA